jgi:hypothetical protein
MGTVALLMGGLDLHAGILQLGRLSLHRREGEAKTMGSVGRPLLPTLRVRVGRPRLNDVLAQRVGS